MDDDQIMHPGRLPAPKGAGAIAPGLLPEQFKGDHERDLSQADSQWYSTKVAGNESSRIASTKALGRSNA